VIASATALVVRLRPLASVALAGLGLLLVFVPPDGLVRPGLLQFLGRFHPLVVHFPIAFVLLLPVFELPLPFLSKSARRGASAILIFSAIVTLIVAIFFGWLIAYAGGFEGTLVMRHAWSAVISGIALSLAVLVWNRDGPRIALILAAFASVSLTGHFGGQLTHGIYYLTEHAPEPLKSLMGGKKEAINTGDRTVYTAVIAPTFQRSCVQCHNPENSQGGLDLTSLAAVLKGGDSGPALVPEKPAESLLVKRITLAPDDLKVMPPAPRPSISPAELAILRSWIASGAKATTEIGELTGLPPEGKALVASRQRALRPKPPQTPDPTKAMPAILASAKAAGVGIVPLSANPKEGLALRTFGVSAQVDDAKFALIAPVAPYLIEAGLADTRITDKALERIAAFVNLRRVDLSRTAVTGTGATKVLALPQLEVLLLTDTVVDDAWLSGVRPGASLRTLGLFQTKVTSQALDTFKKAHPKLTVYGPITVVPPPPAKPRPKAPAAPATKPAAVTPSPELAPEPEQDDVELPPEPPADPAPATPETPAAPATPATTLNALCPYTQKPVVASTVVEVKGANIAFCCNACRKKFLDAPKAQAAILKSLTP
jgi:uncharacterized membrane protein/mono/diheme cytochrome c family protein